MKRRFEPPPYAFIPLNIEDTKCFGGLGKFYINSIQFNFSNKNCAQINYFIAIFVYLVVRSIESVLDMIGHQCPIFMSSKIA